MHPEFMSIGTQTVGIEQQSTALMTSASLMKQDRSRYCVFPETMKQQHRDELIEFINQGAADNNVEPVYQKFIHVTRMHARVKKKTKAQKKMLRNKNNKHVEPVKKEYEKT